MKKIFTLLSLVMLYALTASADDYRRTWDFRQGYSVTTIAQVAADVDTWEEQSTGYQNRVALTTNGTPWVMVNGEKQNIKEFEGMTINSNLAKAKHVQICTTGSGLKGVPCFWLNGSGDAVTVKVPAGENVKFGYTPHGDSNRGFKASGGFADAEGNTQWTTTDNQQINEVELINNNTEEASLTLTTVNGGSHIYYIIIGEGDVPTVVNVGYLYYDAAGNGFEALPLYQAILEEDELHNYTGVNLSSATPNKEELSQYDVVVLDASIPAEKAADLLPNIYWQPVVNFNPALAAAFGFGETLEAEMEVAWAVDAKKSWFTGFDNWALGIETPMFAISNGEMMPAPLKLTGHANATKYIVYGDEEFAYPDSVIAYVYNGGHNSYTYYGLAGDYAEGSEVILKNVIADAASSKSEVTPCPTPTFTTEFGEMKTTVTISDINKNAVIYYTIDGTEPTIESTKYENPIEFTTEATIKAVAIADGYELSDVAEFNVGLYHQAAMPKIYSQGDEKTEDAVVSIVSDANEDVNIWYNFTGSNDTLASTKYDGPITLKRAATITAFATAASPEVLLVQSELATADIQANMLKVRRDEVAHFTADGWNTLADLVLDGEAMTAWSSSNYYFSWGKTAAPSEVNGEQKKNEDGTPMVDENDEPVYEKLPAELHVTEYKGDENWKITSRGQVMIHQTNTLNAKKIGDFNDYCPERAEDLIESLGTKNDIQFGGTSGPASAAIESKNAYAGPFNVVAVVANVNGDKTTGVANQGKVAIQVSADGTNWETIGDTLLTAKVYRNYKKFEVSYENEAPVYVRVASISGSSQCVHDIYVYNHGEKSVAEEEAYTGVEEVVAPAEAAVAVKGVKIIKNGRLVIVDGASEYSVSGAQLK